MRALTLVLMLIVPHPALADALQLRHGAEQFAQGPVALDARVQVPACIGGFAFGWFGVRDRLVEARCTSSSWRLLLVPVKEKSVRFRRGQPVRVESAGPGFVVRVDGIAEGSAAGGMLEVRNSRSRQRFGAVAGADGRLMLPGGQLGSDSND